MRKSVQIKKNYTQQDYNFDKLVNEEKLKILLEDTKLWMKEMENGIYRCPMCNDIMIRKDNYTFFCENGCKFEMCIGHYKQIYDQTGKKFRHKNGIKEQFRFHHDETNEYSRMGKVKKKYERKKTKKK